MLKKIRKLIFHPNKYFYDYFRKRLGFRKYFVTEKIKQLDAGNHHKWLKLLFSHPYIYLYYKFNKRLRNPAYPILISYRIDNIDENIIEGGGKRLALAIELDRNNIIYFADQLIVKNASDNKDPYLAEVILKFKFKGSGNTVFIDDKVIFGPDIRINIAGNSNHIHIGPGCSLLGGSINFPGNENTMELKSGCSFSPGLQITFAKDRNYLYGGPECKFTDGTVLLFASSNGLLFLCGKYTVNHIDARISSCCVLFIGEKTTNSKYVGFWVESGKNLLIGSDVMMSDNLYFRTNDSHLIYNKGDLKRINQARSIIIGDHVWIGQKATLLKGSHMGDGSILGTCSVLSRRIPNNCVAAGSPARVVKEDIIWDRSTDEKLSPSEMLKYNSHVKPKYEYRTIGYDKLLEIDAIDPEISAREKARHIHDIL